jgi:tetratricopeptide (TPR) repeat protein
MIPTPVSALLHYKGCDPKDNRTSSSSSTTTRSKDSSSSSSSSSSRSSGDRIIATSSSSDHNNNINTIIHTTHTSNQEEEFPVLQRVVSELQWAQKEHGFHHPKVAEAWSALGLVKIHMQRDPAQALMCHEHALRIFRELDQKSTQTQEEQQDDDEPQSDTADATTTTTTTSSSSSNATTYATATAITLNDVAYCHEQLQQTEQALQFYQESLRIMQQQGVSQYHPHMVSTTRALFRLGRG